MAVSLAVPLIAAGAFTLGGLAIARAGRYAEAVTRTLYVLVALIGLTLFCTWSVHFTEDHGDDPVDPEWPSESRPR